MLFSLRSVVVLGAVGSSCVCGQDAYKMDWSTDIVAGMDPVVPGEGLIGPDGPWQAVRVLAGSRNRPSSYKISLMWPSGSSTSSILLQNGEWDYFSPDPNAASDPTFVTPDGWVNASIIPDGWVNTMNSSYRVADIPKGIILGDIELNTSTTAISRWDVSFPNGRSYTPVVGVLGLGYDQPPMGPSSGEDFQSLLEQFKASGTTASMFCGLHIGSASLNQSGSMVLGGYEQNRVLGEVGTFDLGATRGPSAFLLDVVLDVETGVSPFNQSSSISLWHGLEDDPDRVRESNRHGGRTGSRLISVNPSVPYMYLPKGLCETAARYLPLTWDAGLGLYTWNINDEFTDIVSSPAYMGIVLADRQSKNITIKVPFKLLNLTLLPPIVDTPTQYFPCQPSLVDDDRTFDFYVGPVLGRAFLQAAFLGFEYEHSLAYIAQAPGPTMEQRIIKTFQPNDSSITPNALGTFASSWASSWKVLESNHSRDNSTVNSTNTSSSNDTTSSKPTTSLSQGGLSGGAGAGVAVGSLLGALGIVAAAALLWRKRRGNSRKVARDETNEASVVPTSDQSTGPDGYPSELAHEQHPSEAQGNAPPHEMVEDGVHEAPTSPIPS